MRGPGRVTLEAAARSYPAAAEAFEATRECRLGCRPVSPFT